MALGLPSNFGCAPAPVPWVGQPGKGVVLSGSCSVATRGQVAYHAAREPSREIIATEVIEGRLRPADVAQWLLQTPGLPLAYSSADPDAVRAVQAKYGPAQAATALETFFANVARHVVNGGASRIITAGGETSGAVVEGLSLDQLEIGPEIAPGVPALRASQNLVVALKSGNFGTEDFFENANRLLEGRT